GSATGTGRRPPRSYGHLEGDVRWRRLFSATRFFLRIDGGGGVEGTRWRERPGKPDPAGCRGCGRGGRCRGWTGEEAGRRRLGSATGPLHARPRESPQLFPLGKSQPNPNCKFTERIEENGYNTYASLHWRHRGRPMFLSLNSKGRPRQGGKTRRQHLSTHFLPMLVS
ncbi:FGF22 factor, partial [Corvus moneduloides]|nr:FGF22 factor [Corvus moneduloides]